MKTQFAHFVLTIGLTVTSGNLAWSQSSTYFNRSTFTNACRVVPGSKQSISFANLLYSQEGPVVTISNVTFTGRYLIRSSSSAGPILYNFDSDVPLGIHFANGARAFGGDFSSYGPFTATLSLDNGEILTFSGGAYTAPTFFGFISPTPFTDLIFSDGGTFPGGLHEERIGNLFMVLEVPEPAGITLLGLGVTALFTWRLCRIGKP